MIPVPVVEPLVWPQKTLLSLLSTWARSASNVTEVPIGIPSKYAGENCDAEFQYVVARKDSQFNPMSKVYVVLPISEGYSIHLASARFASASACSLEFIPPKHISSSTPFTSQAVKH